MKFERIKVIVDTHGSLENKEIRIRDKDCFLEPCDIQTAEWFETRLERAEIPYVLIQCEVELPPCDKYPDGRWKRGYAIFTKIRPEAEFAVEALKEEIRADAQEPKLTDAFGDDTEVA